MTPQVKKSKVIALPKSKNAHIPFTETPSEAFAIFFQYSPDRSLVTAWHGDVSRILGAPIDGLSQHGDLFLKYTHEDDRFRMVSHLDSLSKGELPLLSITYRWLHQRSRTYIMLHCQAECRSTGFIEGIIIPINPTY